MPGVIENRRKWSEHNWEHGGHRWSPGGTPAGTAMLWHRSLRPRLLGHLPARTVLEIAPGFGRWTTHLLAECEALVGVDLTSRCVEVCQERFPFARARFFQNDGATLPMVADESIDLAFSFDSLVHVEAPQIETYLRELARTLRPGGVAFLHHSNLGAYASLGGVVPSYIGERHWRAASVSARFVREACQRAGLACVSQELLNWIGRDAIVDRYRLPGAHVALTDTFTVCARTPVGASTRVLVNRRYVDEWRELIALTAVYAGAPGPTESSDATPEGVDAAHRTDLRWRLRAAAARLERWSFVAREPIARRLRAGRCPDCATQLEAQDTGPCCSRCRVCWMLR